MSFDFVVDDETCVPKPKAEPDMLTTALHKKIQDIIDEYYLESGRYVTINGSIREKDKRFPNFTLFGGPKQDTICKLVL
jgi:hypothetical protein